MPPKNADPSSISDFDMEKYRAELADLDISDEEKDQLIHALSELMRAFVDIAWDPGGDSHPEIRELLSQNENKRKKRAKKASGTQAKQAVSRPSPTSSSNRDPATQLSPAAGSPTTSKRIRTK